MKTVNDYKIASTLLFRIWRLANFSIYEAATSTRNTAISGNHRLVRKFLIPSRGMPYARPYRIATTRATENLFILLISLPENQANTPPIAKNGKAR